MPIGENGGFAECLDGFGDVVLVFLEFGAVFYQIDDGARHGVLVAMFDEQAKVGGDLCSSAGGGVEGDAGKAVAHGFGENQPKSLGVRGEDEKRAVVEIGRDIFVANKAWHDDGLLKA